MTSLIYRKHTGGKEEQLNGSNWGTTNTKFFHANASIRHRGNLIKQLVSDQGVTLHSHQDKETVIWHEFKERLATSNFIAFTIDPSVFIQRFKNMDFLEDPFMPQEIDDIVKSLPNDKSPGPNGFNNEFLKSCWQIIKADFYNLCNAFHQGSLCLKSIKKPSYSHSKSGWANNCL